MLKLIKNPEFKATIDINVPGSVKAEKIDLTFKYMTKSEYADFSKLHEADKIDDILPLIVKGWSGVCDENGKAIEYSAENLAMLLDVVPSAAVDIYRGFNSELFGARIKN